ncbi:MAG: hypothetical protein ABEJ99_00125 [Candidatus Nanohaloarchaea archaeon]
MENTDTFYVRIDNDLNPSLSVNGASVDGASISSSSEIVDGYDNDGVQDTIKFAVSPTGGGITDLNVTVDSPLDIQTGTTAIRLRREWLTVSTGKKPRR